MNKVELILDETLADFEIQDWIDTDFSIQYPDIKATIKKGCQGNCGDKYREENEKLKLQNARMSRMIFNMRNCSNCNGIIYGGQRTEKCKRCEMFSLWEFDDRTEKHIQNNS